MVLHPDKYNKHVQYAWRFDPCELVRQGQRKPPPRAPLVDMIVRLMMSSTSKLPIIRYLCMLTHDGFNVCVVSDMSLSGRSRD